MKELNNFLSEKEVDKSKPHPTKKGKGADDDRYVRAMEKYKRARHHLGIKEANKLLDAAMKIRKEGDVSENAKLAAAYI